MHIRPVNLFTMAAKVGSMYVRVKRGTQTVFLHVEPTDSFAVVKQKLGKVRGTECGTRGGGGEPGSLVLFAFFVCCPVPSPCSVAVRTRETWRWADAERGCAPPAHSRQAGAERRVAQRRSDDDLCEQSRNLGVGTRSCRYLFCFR